MVGRRGDVEGLRFPRPAGLLRNAIAAEPALRDRFGGRGPVRHRSCSDRWPSTSCGDDIDGLLLAGDAAGFIDPMTGDGLRFAVRGGELAAAAALEALEHGWSGVHARLARRAAAGVRGEVALQPGAARAGVVVGRRAGRVGAARASRRASCDG